MFWEAHYSLSFAVLYWKVLVAELMPLQLQVYWALLVESDVSELATAVPCQHSNSSRL